MQVGGRHHDDCVCAHALSRRCPISIWKVARVLLRVFNTEMRAEQHLDASPGEEFP